MKIAELISRRRHPSLHFTHDGKRSLLASKKIKFKLAAVGIKDHNGSWTWFTMVSTMVTLDIYKYVNMVILTEISFTPMAPKSSIIWKTACCAGHLVRAVNCLSI